jgi:23S rRNA pseudouridine1911/1915/1917 synthase
MPLPEKAGEFRFPVGAENAGRRLDVFLSRKFRRSRTSLTGRLSGCVFDGEGRPLRWSHRLRSGDVVVVHSEVRPEPEVEVRYRLLYRDEWLVAVDKGPGAPVHPVRGFRTRTVLTRLRDELGRPALQLAHRLDRETSGVLLLAEGTPVLRVLMEAFAARRVKKQYLAVVRGNPAWERLRVEAPLALDRSFPILCRMKVDLERGQKAATDFAVLARRPDRALVRATPLTGRQHQIRLHLAHAGHPVLGDKLYQEDGKPYLAMIRDRLAEADFARLGHVRQALHASVLELDHPATGQRLRLEAPLPEDLAALLDPAGGSQQCR